MVRKHIVFYGSVQGVGFRYRARHAAEHFGCTGWAKNEWNGTVSMEIQGEENAIDQVISATLYLTPSAQIQLVPSFRWMFTFAKPALRKSFLNSSGVGLNRSNCRILVRVSSLKS